MLFSNDDIGNAYLARLREILDWKEIFNSLWKREGNTFIHFLLDAGLDVNALNKFGTTMLSYAAECGNMEIVEFLTQKGADGNVKNANGSMPLHMAAKHGHKELVKFFLSSIDFVDIRDVNGNTPLHYVADETDDVLREATDEDSYQEIVHCLLNSGAKLDAVNEKGDTPLLRAARNEHKDRVKLLIRLGANVVCKGKYDRTLLHYSCENGWTGIVRHLLERKVDIDLDARSSVTPWSEGPDTPLTIAGSQGHYEAVKLLIEAGANIQLKTRLNQTLLHFACRWSWLDIVKYLVGVGCDINAEDSDGKTPLLYVVDGWVGEPLAVVQYLIGNGADIRCFSRLVETTMLHVFCECGSLDAVMSLTSRGCDLNIQCGQARNTPLHVAVKFRELQIVKRLVEVGADFNLQDHEGNSAFHCFLVSPMCLEGIAFFLESGAYFQLKDYIAISENPLLKEGILKDFKLCTQALMNKLNMKKLNVNLRVIYKIPAFSERLPPFEKLENAIKRCVELDIQRSVKHDIQTEGFCNVMKIRPMNLAILTVDSLIKHYFGNFPWCKFIEICENH